MLNITNYQRRANQNHHLKPFRMAITKKPTVNAGEGVEKRNPPASVSGTINWGSHYEEDYGDSRKN